MYDVTVLNHNSIFIKQMKTAAVAQWVRALAPQAEGWVFNPSRDKPKS